MNLRKITVVISMVLLGTLSVAAQRSAKESEITRTVLNYAEGWYEGDGAKMESALHPDLAKTKRAGSFRGQDSPRRVERMAWAKLDKLAGK